MNCFTTDLRLVVYPQLSWQKGAQVRACWYVSSREEIAKKTLPEGFVSQELQNISVACCPIAHTYSV